MLSGSLDTFGLEHVLRFIAAAEVTGRIDVVRTRVAGTLLLDRGAVVGASRGEHVAGGTEHALEAAADLFEGSGGAFVLSRLTDPPRRLIDLDGDAFFAEMERRVRARAAADLLRELTDGSAPTPAAPMVASAGPIHLDRPPVRVLTREEQRMRLRL